MRHKDAWFGFDWGILMSVLRRWASVFLVAALCASVLGVSPAGAQDEAAPVVDDAAGEVSDDVELLVDVVEPVVETAVRGGSDRVTLAAPVDVASEESQRSGWVPVVGRVGVEAGRDVGVADTPVRVEVGSELVEAGVDSVSVSVLDDGFASQLSPFGAAVSFGFESAAGVPVNARFPYTLSLDLGDVNLGDSADVFERLTFTIFEGCELFNPDLSEIEGTDIDVKSVLPRVACETADEMDAVFDVETRELVVDVDPAKIAADRAEHREALLKSGVKAAELDPKRDLVLSPANELGLLDADGGRARTPNAVIEAAAAGVVDAESGGPKQLIVLPHTRESVRIFVAQNNTGDPIIGGVSSAAASSSGDFSALPVPTLTDAQVGLFSGSAEVSYPIPVPAAAAGPSPSVSLVYSSASVDGMTMGTNNQSGPLGVGWSLAAGGSIQRSLKACNDPAAPGDRCISGSPDEVYTLSLAGKSSKLIRTNTGSGYPKEFRLQSDPFWRIRLWSGSGVSTPDHLNEWWSVETPDGTVYRLGSQTQSVDWLPVWYPSGGCGATYALCDTARQWNVDTVTDAFGNEMSYEYAQEHNWYNARQITTTYKRKYVRASRLETITYGANPGLSKDANARVVLDYEWRCNTSTVFGNCGQYATGFNDVPADLWCGWHAEANEYVTVCTEKAATFWTQLRFTGALSQVADGSGGWVTVANHDPEQSWVRDTSSSYLDSKKQLVLNAMAERPIDANGSTAGGSYEKSGFNPLHAIDRDGESGTGTNPNIFDVGFEGAVTSFGDEDWIRFDDVWLGNSTEPATEITVRVSALRTGTIEVRIGSATGTVIGSIPVTSLTGGSKDFVNYNVNLTTPTSGVRNVYLRGERGTGLTNTIGFINWAQFGTATIDDLPEVATASFNAGGYDFRDNRLNHPSGTSAMRFPRIETFTNQLGGTVEFVYGQDHGCTTGVAVPPGSWDNNHLDCFPQWDTSSTPNGWTIFNKWVVKTMTRGDTFSAQPDVVTTYAYTNPGWGFADNPDSSSDTWNEFRGYNKVTVTDAAGKTEHRFHQGLDDEHQVGGGTANVSVTRSDATTIPDHYALRGMTYETRTLKANGTTEITRNWTTYANTTTTGITGRDAPRFVAPSQTDSRVDLTASTRTLYTYNSWGAPLSVNEQGSTATSTDNRTTVTRYYPATTTTGLDDWRGTFPCVTAVRAGDSTAAPSTTSAAAYDRWSQQFYDTNTATTCAAAVTKPLVRRNAMATSGSGRVTTVIVPDNRGRVSTVTDPKGYVTVTNYDNDHGQVVKVTNEKGWFTENFYDEWRRPTQSKDVNGRSSYTYYDEYSRVTAMREPQDASENADTIQITYFQDASPAYVQTRTRLDGADYTNSATFVDGFGRTLLNRYLAPETGANWATAVSYDEQGRQQYASAQYAIYADSVTTFAYPGWDTVPSFTEATYDDGSRPAGTTTRKGTDPADILFDTAVEYFGFRTRFTDQNGDWTDTTVDGLGRSLDVTEQQNNLDVDYTYNAAGDLLTVTAPDNLVTTLTYDKAGRKLTADDPDSGAWAYAYDANSNLTTQTDPSGDVSVYTFDDLNRRTQVTVNGGLRGRWWYDLAGNLGLIRDLRHYKPRDAAGTDLGTVYQRTYYDTWGRKTQDQTFIPEPDTSNMFRFRTVYTLRDDNQPASINHPSDTWYGYGYKVNYGYNARTGAAETLAENGGSGETIVSDVAWNQAGQAIQMDYGPAGVDGIVKWAYHPNTLRLASTRMGTAVSDTAYAAMSYVTDNNANITMIYDLRNAGQRQCFTYDKLDRLLTGYTDNTNCDGYTAYGAGQFNDTYTYNAGGNITTKTGSGSGTHNGTYTYGDTNHAHAVTATSDGATFVYNADGDMTTRNLAGQPAQTLAWNEEHRLAKVTEGGTVQAEFIYGLNDTRVRRKTGSTYTYYHSDGTEYSHDGTTGVFTYYHRIGGRTVAYTTSDDSKTTWMFSDIINSTSVTRDDTGTTSTQRYTPWGETRTDGGLTTDHTYTGQKEDTSTGLRFYNARYQDPVIGRFISADTIIPNPANGQNYNRYAYVGNNPIRYSDPSGHCLVGMGDNSGAGCDNLRSAIEAHFAGGSEGGRQLVNPNPVGKKVVDQQAGRQVVDPFGEGFNEGVLAALEDLADILEPNIVGYCAGGELQVGVAALASGCQVFDSNGPASIISIGVGEGTPSLSASAGALLSNANSAQDLAGFSVCGSLSAGHSGTICFPLVGDGFSWDADIDYSTYVVVLAEEVGPIPASASYYLSETHVFSFTPLSIADAIIYYMF